MAKTVTIELPDNLLIEVERAQLVTGEDLAAFVTMAARERAAVLAANRFFPRRTEPFEHEALVDGYGDGGELSTDAGPGGFRRES